MSTPKETSEVSLSRSNDPDVGESGTRRVDDRTDRAGDPDGHDGPLIHSRYTLWTLAASSLVVVTVVVGTFGGASLALLAATVWVCALLIAPARARWTWLSLSSVCRDDVADERGSTRDLRGVFPASPVVVGLVLGGALSVLAPHVTRPVRVATFAAVVVLGFPLFVVWTFWWVDESLSGRRTRHHREKDCYP